MREMSYAECLEAPWWVPSWFARETEIARHVEAVIDVDLERGQSFPSRAERDRFQTEFQRFAEWAGDMGVAALPASGHVAAFYLIDLLLDGATANDIAIAARSITFTHDMAREYLDQIPIRAALDYATDAP
jgi:hypothetical protein